MTSGPLFDIGLDEGHVIGCIGGFAADATPAGDAAAGESKVVACGACHGADGNSMSPFPKLAGQGNKYLYKQLLDIRDGARSVPTMAGQLDGKSDQDLAEVYATNLFPFIKPGKMTRSIPSALHAWAASEFAVPQIRIVAPLLVVAFGLPAVNALRAHCGLPPVGKVADAVAAPFQVHGASVWCQSHPGGLGRANRNKGGVDRVSEDWRRMSATIGPLGSAA